MKLDRETHTMKEQIQCRQYRRLTLEATECHSEKTKFRKQFLAIKLSLTI